MSPLQRGGWPHSYFPNMTFKLNKRSPQAKGLIAWFPTLGSVGTGRLVDYSGYATPTGFRALGEPLWVRDGDMGAAIHFDGVNDWVDLGNTSYWQSVTSNITLSIWTRTIDLDTACLMTKYAAGTDTEWGLRIGVLGESYAAKFTVRDDDFIQAIGTTQIPGATAPLHLITGVHDGVNLYIYVDGIQENSEPLVALPAVNSSLAIGRRGSSATEQYEGTVGDIRIYNRALSPSEVWALYANPWELYQPITRLWSPSREVLATRRIFITQS